MVGLAALLGWSAGDAPERGCGRIDWHVRAENADGIRLYERHGDQVVEDRLSCRIEGQRLADLATPLTS